TVRPSFGTVIRRGHKPEVYAALVFKVSIRISLKYFDSIGAVSVGHLFLVSAHWLLAHFLWDPINSVSLAETYWSRVLSAPLPIGNRIAFLRSDMKVSANCDA